MRRIHQLQTAWWVYPTAEHTRFQHILGAMHLASRVVARLYDSLNEAAEEVPSRGYVETLLRMAGLLHDVGHGPFGHFFDEHFLRGYGLTHETLGAHIICEELGDALRQLRGNPNSQLADGEQLCPQQIAWLITRPRENDARDHPRWLHLLRSLLSGIYTIDNMDFVLRDAYMSGYSQQSFDVDRLLHYSFFTQQGLTIHDRGMNALMRFMSVRADLFRSVYFHRTVRAIDLTLADLFADSHDLLFPGNPLDYLDDYREFTEWSLLEQVGQWYRNAEPSVRELGVRWQALLRRQIKWLMICQRTRVFTEDDSEQSSIFSDPVFVERKVREQLRPELRDIPLRVDIARHIHRPHTRGPTSGENYLYDSAHDRVRPLNAHELYGRLPTSHRICRIYSTTEEHTAEVATALDSLIGGGIDDLTNM
jgi:HD superfamily phosphohydrolase